MILRCACTAPAPDSVTSLSEATSEPGQFSGQPAPSLDWHDGEDDQEAQRSPRSDVPDDRERVPGPAALETLRTADVIMGCLDNLHVRADLQELPSRFLIPDIDVGVNIRAIKDPDPDGPRVTIGGNVLTLIPGGFCMWCSDFLSKENLDAELNAPTGTSSRIVAARPRW